MTAILAGRMATAAFLDDGEQRAIKEQYMPAIQKLAKTTLAPDDVHVRGMLLCNSAPDFYYSRFTNRALTDIAEMVPGRSVMVGHDYSRSPIGRFFAAKTTDRPAGRRPKDECKHVEALFYTPNDAEGTAAVKRIDTGVWREVSIGFRCLTAPCTICRDFIGTCGHAPGEVYDRGGICLYEMDDISTVYEGSNVFAGGQKETSYFVPDGARASLDARGEVLRWDQLPELKRVTLLGHRGDHLLRPGAYSRSGIDEEIARAAGRDEPRRRSVQVVHALKDRFESAGEARQWCRENDFKSGTIEEGDDAYRFQQHAPASFEDGSLKSVVLTKGVKAMVGKLKGNTGGDRALTVEQFMSGESAGL